MSDGEANLDSTPAAPSPGRPLMDYSAQPAKRNPLRVLGLVLLILMLSFGAVWCWQTCWPQVMRFQQERVLESAIPPTGTVIYSDVPALQATLGNQTLYQIYGPSNGVLPALRRHSPWIVDVDQRGARLQSGVSPCGIMSVANGTGRLVSLAGWADSEYPPTKKWMSFPCYSVDSRATLWPGTRHKQLAYHYPQIELLTSDELTIYTGDIDPKDSSHIVMNYTLNGQAGAVDGWLLPNDNMAFHIRSGPATTRPSKNYLSAPMK